MHDHRASTDRTLLAACSVRHIEGHLILERPSGNETDLAGGPLRDVSFAGATTFTETGAIRAGKHG
ncbi:MAG: hypothetical protein ACM3H9_03610 [Rhodospirillaceae bacterium]